MKNRYMKLTDLISGSLIAVNKLGNGVHVNKTIRNIEINSNNIIFTFSDKSTATASFDISELAVINS